MHASHLGRRAAATALAALAGVLASATVAAAPLRAVPVEVRSPDGRVLQLLATGDEFHRRVHDAQGFTVVRDPVTSRVVYATLRNGSLAPTRLEVGRASPSTLRLAPGLDDAPEVIRARMATRRAHQPRRSPSAPTRGEINNLVMFVRFADEAPPTTAVAKYESMLNSVEPGVPSVRGYFREASYGALEVRSHLLPKPTGTTLLFWQDKYPRSHYQPYDASTNPDGYTDEGDSMVREQTMARRAMDDLASQIPPGTNLDGDEDGFVDNMTLVVSGKPDGWSSLLWPHQSLILADQIFIGDLQVLTYNLQLNDTVVDRSRVGVLAHEMFHTLGAPDLYHYSHDQHTPAGPWDLMERDLDTPQHMSLHLKTRYGKWSEKAPLITESGTYVVRPLTEPEGQGWRLPIPGQPKQFFQVEYRRKTGTYESSLPSSGLLIWRVDERWWGNNDGPPDELYVFRPSGTLANDGDVHKAPFSADAGRTTFAPGSNPSPFDQLGAEVGVRITDVSATGGDSMSFAVCMAYAACFLKQCGDDGCGGTCGTCADTQVCEDRICVTEQRCSTLSACLAACEDEPCRESCRRVPPACPAPGACRDAGTCDEAGGECTYPLAAAGTTCDDHDACSLNDRCQADGTCLGETDPACLADDTLPEPTADVPASDPGDEPHADVLDPDAAADIPASPDPAPDVGTDLAAVDPGTADVPADEGLDPAATDPGAADVTADEGPDPAATDPGAADVTADEGPDPAAIDPGTADVMAGEGPDLPIPETASDAATEGPADNPSPDAGPDGATATHRQPASGCTAGTPSSPTALLPLLLLAFASMARRRRL